MLQHSGFHATIFTKTSEVNWHGHLLQFIEAFDIFGQVGVSLTQNDIVFSIVLGIEVFLGLLPGKESR